MLGIVSLKADDISPSQAASHIGTDQTVSGIVTQISSTPKGTTFLNFDGKFPNQIFNAVIFPANLKKFPDIKLIEGKKASVWGVIKEYKGKPEIILMSPAQIEISK